MNRVEYELVEDRARRMLVVAPYNTTKNASLRAIFLSLERLYETFDSLAGKPWVKDPAGDERDRAVVKFVMSRLQLANSVPWPTFAEGSAFCTGCGAKSLAEQLPPGQAAKFVPRTGADAESDAAFEVAPPTSYVAAADGVFKHTPLLLEAAVKAAGLLGEAPADPSEPPAEPPAAAPAAEPMPDTSKSAQSDSKPAPEPAAAPPATVKGKAAQRVSPASCRRPSFCTELPWDFYSCFY